MGKKPKKPRTMNLKRKKGKIQKAEEEAEEKAEEEEEEQHEPVRKRQRSTKEDAVAELLSRWWYALPDWPPDDDSYYEKELTKRKYRKVAIEEWEWVNEKDDQGRRKAYELSQFRGCFRASNGDLLDMRP